MRRRIIIMLAALLVLASLAGCGSQKRSKHAIEVSDSYGIIRKCPKTAASGENVTILANDFMDVIPKIYINGEDSGKWTDGRSEYVFVMPDEDVVVSTKLKNASIG